MLRHVSRLFFPIAAVAVSVLRLGAPQKLHLWNGWRMEPLFSSGERTFISFLSQCIVSGRRWRYFHGSSCSKQHKMHFFSWCDCFSLSKWFYFKTFIHKKVQHGTPSFRHWCAELPKIMVLEVAAGWFSMSVGLTLNWMFQSSCQAAVPSQPISHHPKQTLTY